MRTFPWNQDNRLTGINLPGTAADSSYAYNGAGTRVSRTLSGATQTWKRAGAGVTASVLRDGTNTYNPGVSSRSGGVSTYVHAGMKNTTAQSVGASLGATKQFDAFGLEVASTGTWQTAFGYAGNFGYQESDAGIKLLGNRYYDAETGRFLTRDPIKDGRNWYGYCDNDPIKHFDSGGLSPKASDGAGSLGVGVLMTPGYTDGDGQFVVGHVGTKKGKPWVDPRTIHLDLPHPRHPKPHLNSDVFQRIDHKVVPDWTVPLGSTKFVKGLGRLLVAVSVLADIVTIVKSDDPAAEVVKSITVLHGAMVGAAIGSSILPGVGTVVGGMVGGLVVSSIVYWNE